MRVVNSEDIDWQSRSSPSGKFSRHRRTVSEALGRDPESMHLSHRHPFDVEITKLPPGAIAFPYHSHSAQWEFYHVISGSGSVRDDDGTTSIRPGDAFLFKPGEPHQIVNDGTEDLVYYVIADNPIGESCYYPDSKKWAVRLPEYTLIRGESVDYYDGEDRSTIDK